jgi:hypothetical protein
MGSPENEAMGFGARWAGEAVDLEAQLECS